MLLEEQEILHQLVHHKDKMVMLLVQELHLEEEVEEQEVLVLV